MYYGRYNKYGSKKSVCSEGHTHDSAKEADRCSQLHLLQRAGEIADLEIQKEFLITPAIKYGKPMKNERKSCYRADFVYYDKALGKTVIEDSKGMRTKEYILKRKLVKQLYCQDGETIFIET